MSLLMADDEAKVSTMMKNLFCMTLCDSSWSWLFSDFKQKLAYYKKKTLLAQKFSFGGLTPSTDMLRLIEEIHGDDDEQMQNSFETYDSCSRIGEIITIGMTLPPHAHFFLNRRSRWVPSGSRHIPMRPRRCSNCHWRHFHTLKRKRHCCLLNFYFI